MALKKLVGTVVSNKLPKTVTVRIDMVKTDRKYSKGLARHKKILAHLAEGVNVSLGEVVTLQACRPLSAKKHFVVVKEEEKK